MAATNRKAPTKKPRVFAMSFASVYPLYVQKAEKKGRTKEEVDEIIAWLTGYCGDVLQRALDAKVDLESFFAQAPRMNPNAGRITGVVCGVRVEDVADPLMQKRSRPCIPARCGFCVWSQNLRAQAIYQRLGFNTVGEYLFPVGAWS